MRENQNHVFPGFRWSSFPLAGLFMLCLAVAVHAQQFTANVTYSESIRRNGSHRTALYKVNASIPMDIALDELDETTVLWLDHGSSWLENDTVDLIGSGESFTLGEDPSYTPGKTSATICRAGAYLSMNWTATNIAFNGYILASPDMYISSVDPDGNVSPGDPIAGGVTMPFSFQDFVYITFGSSDFYHSAQVAGQNYAKSAVSFFSQANGGSVVLNHGSFTIVADLTPPVVSIVSPKQNTVVLEDLVSLQVSSSDNVGLGLNLEGSDYFAYSVNGGYYISVPSDQTNRASFDVSGLNYGVNTIRVYAYDTSGNEGHTDLQVYYAYASQLSLTVVGPGTVSGITDGQSAEIGKNINAKAIPMPGKVFAGWQIGDTLIRQSSLAYPMSDGMSITATFVDNPFGPSKGTFSGLFFPNAYETSKTLQNSGAIFVTESALGSFTSKLTMTSGTVSFAGQFYPNADGTADTDPYLIVLPTKQTALVQLSMVTDTTADSFGQISGTVTAYGTQSWNSDIEAELVYFDTNVVVGGAGIYNFATSAAATDSSGPNGYNFGTVTVSKTGAAAGSLNLADSGTANTVFTGSVTKSGRIPFFVALYKTNGAAFGFIDLAKLDAGALSAVAGMGTLNWIKNPTGGIFYPYGINATSDVVGAKNVASPDNTLHLGSISYGGAGLDQKTKVITYQGGVIQITDPSGNEDKLAVKVVPASGKFSGTFVDPVSNKTRTFSGLTVGTSEGDANGYGLFIGTSGSGFVFLDISLQ